MHHQFPYIELLALGPRGKTRLVGVAAFPQVLVFSLPPDLIEALGPALAQISFLGLCELNGQGSVSLRVLRAFRIFQSKHFLWSFSSLGHQLVSQVRRNCLEL